ncbi:MAG: hypothetical protein QOJ92_2959 [Frankiales bacterium]|nr:hypothetical protein [Frankiales bacterium]
MLQALAKTRLPRSVAVVVAGVLMAFTLPTLSIGVASAATPGGFEIDGNFVHNSATDWADVLTGPVSDDNAPEATYFSASSKETDLPKAWTSSGAPPPKGDIGKTFLYTHTSAGHSYVDFGWIRNSGTGTDTYYVELNKLGNYNPSGLNVPKRSTGDLRFKIHETGGASLALQGISIWTGNENVGTWSPAPGAGSGFDFAVNAAAVPILGGGTAAADTFLEISLDLTGLIGLAPSCPGAFGTFNMRSTTGETATNLKEYITGLAAHAGSNCSALTIVKKFKNANGTAGAALGGATFTISPDPTPGAVGGSLDVTDNASGDSDPAAGTILIDPARPGVTYTITEKTAPAGYVKDTTPQQVTTPTDGTGAGALTFLDPLGSVTYSKTDAVTGLPLSGATFTVVKSGGGSSTTVTDNGANDASNVAGTIKVADIPLGTYTITETAAPAGYTAQAATVGFSLTQASPDAVLGVVFTDPRISTTLKVQKLAALGGAPLDGAGFTLYRVKEAPESADVAMGSCTSGTPTAGSGACSISGLLWDHYYYWVETSAPAGYNLPVDATSATIHITKDNAGTTMAVTQFRDDTSTISTTATSAQTVGGTVSDSATLGGVRSDAGGTVTFNLYGPFTSSVDPVGDAANVCKLANLAWTTTAQVSGPGHYSSGTHVVTGAGTYYWVAVYSGDTNDVGVSGACGDAGETSTAGKQPTSLTTHATDSTLPNASITDKVTLSGATADATGTITVKVYADSACGTTALGTWTMTVSGNGDYTTAPAYAPASAGTYYWKASYGGDVNNAPSSEACGALTESSHERSVVARAPTSLRTTATDAQLPTGTITDTVTLSGGTATATGDITVGVYADSACDTAVLASWTIPASGMGPYTTSPSYTPTKAGTYYWLASYAGDANNLPSAEACGALNEVSHEVSTVTPASTTTLTAAMPSSAVLPAAQVGGTGPLVHDTATVSGGTSDISGTVTFNLYGPSEAGEGACATDALVFTSTVALVAGAATSGDFTPTEKGSYWWTAAYSGDANNLPSAGTCGAEGESLAVTQPDLGLDKTADPESGSVVQPGQQIDYTIEIPNIGDADATSVTVVDTLPADVTPVEGSISDGGVYDATAGTITWVIQILADDVRSLTYSVTVDDTADQGETLHNTVGLGTLTATTDHVVATGDLGLVKTVSPTGSAKFGDTLTYGLTATALGDLDQHAVVVTDVVPADTTYVAGSAGCDLGTCTASYDATSNTVTWALGDMASGASRHVSFKVTVDTPPAAADGSIPATVIHNVGLVESTETPSTPSNRVDTPVTTVLGVKHIRKPPETPLPFTGSTLPLGPAALVGLAMLGLGVLLTSVRRRRPDFA